jgi:hypothetical protein
MCLKFSDGKKAKKLSPRRIEFEYLEISVALSSLEITNLGS